VYRNRARLPRARATLARVGMEVLQTFAEPYARHELHTSTWKDAERGMAGDDELSLVARLLARADDAHRYPGGPSSPSSLHAVPAPSADGRAGPSPAPLPSLPPGRPREVAARQDQHADHRPALGVADRTHHRHHGGRRGVGVDVLDRQTGRHGRPGASATTNSAARNMRSRSPREPRSRRCMDSVRTYSDPCKA